MAKDNNEANIINNNLSTPSSSGIKHNARSKPYDANNSFVKKVATKVTDLIPQPSWISKWFNSSQDEVGLQALETDNAQYQAYDEKQSQPPLKRPCIRMDVTHPPGTFNIKPSRNKNSNAGGDADSLKAHFSNHNETTQDFLEPSVSSRVPRFVSSTPAFPIASSSKVTDTLPTLNLLISEQNNVAANGVDDNSETSESTSGCSSLIPQNNRQEASNTNFSSPFANKRRYVDNKLDFTNHLQSPRSLFLDSSTRETLSSRRPSFNPMMVTNTLDRSASLQSPFYPGNTMFGGSNAASLYRRGNSLLADVSQYQMPAPKRTSVQVNPSNDSTTCDPSGMSHTARRILETLEQFSSPLTDAKKMPVRNIIGGNTSVVGNNTTLNSSTLNRKRAREEEMASPRVGLRHLTRELTVPTVPDLLRIRRRQKLQNTTVNARKIMSARTVPATLTTQEYHIRTENEAEPKRKAPLKAKKKTNLEEEETVEAVNLPSIALPISNLPRFDISLPQCPKPNISCEKQMQNQSKQQVERTSAFKFASPIKLTDGAKNLESINNFTFSKPMSPSKVNFTEMNDTCELSRTLSVGSNDTLTSQPSFPNFVWTGPSQTLKPKEKEHQTKTPLVASELKSGSVMDFFAKQTTTTSSIDHSNVWECNECLIKNSAKETHCVACKNSKHDSSDDIEILECPNEDPNAMEENKLMKSSTKMPSSLRPNANNPLDKFTSSAQTLIVNKSKTSESAINISSKPFSETTNESFNLSNASQFNVAKPAKTSWECPCCMVRNTDTVSTCPCCNTAKPGSINVSPKRKIENSAPSAISITSGFGDKFKKPEGSWSCDVCMVQNKSDANKCVACETPQPGLAKVAKTNLSGTSLSNTLSSGFGDKFKKPEGSWTCDTCMIQNKTDANKCVACETPRAGATADAAPPKSSSKLQFNVDMPANAGSFKFGIDKAENSTNLTPKTNGFTFGAPTTSSQPTGGFSFGVPSDSAKSKESDTTTDTTTKAPAFAFKSDSVAAAATFQFGAKPSETVDKEEKTPATTAVFQFGSGAVDAKNKKDTNSSTSATFSFGASVKPDSSRVPSTGFVFGSPTSTSEKKEEKKTDATTAGGLFVFGAQGTTTQIAKDSTADKTTKSTTDTPTNNFMFGSPKPTSEVSKVEDKTPAAVATASKLEPSKSTSLFSAPTEQSKSVTPTFSFGSSGTSTTTAPSLSTTSASLFSFGAQSKTNVPAASNTTTPLPAFGSPNAPKPTFSFGKSAESTGVTANQQENKPMFGSTAASPSFGGQTNQATPSLFGSSIPTTNASDNKSLMFGGPEKKNASGFGETDNKIAAFGSTANKAETTGFGTVTPTPSAFATPTAGTGAASPFGATPGLFGNGAAPSFSTTTPTPNIFSATTKPSETSSSTSGLFTFGQSSQTTAPVTGGFNFSSGSNAPSNVDQQKGIFSFGASSNNPQQVGNGFNTSSFSSASATPSSNFTFNAPPKPDTSSTRSPFGQGTTAPNATPMFNAPSNTTGQPTGLPPAYPGTTNSTPAASSGFNFGNTNVPNSFNFGRTPAPSTGGFNFNAPSTPAAAPAFNPNAQPTFNFTAGNAPTAFNAPPTRKIKKAVRRMPRQ